MSMKYDPANLIPGKSKSVREKFIDEEMEYLRIMLNRARDRLADSEKLVAERLENINILKKYAYEDGIELK